MSNHRNRLHSSSLYTDLTQLQNTPDPFAYDNKQLNLVDLYKAHRAD